MEKRDSKKLNQALQQQALLMRSFASITHKCFLKCVTKPGRSLSSTEDSCATNCCDRYFDAQVYLLTRLQEKAEQEKTNGGMVSH